MFCAVCQAGAKRFLIIHITLPFKGLNYKRDWFNSQQRYIVSYENELLQIIQLGFSSHCLEAI
jgi:hypothetical protein